MSNTTRTWSLWVDAVQQATGLTKEQANALFENYRSRDPHSEVEMYIREEKSIVKYAVQSANEEETNIFTEDGGVASSNRNEDEGHMVTIFYQSKVTLFDRHMWHELDEGNSHYKDYEGESVVTPKMVYDALHWLCPMADSYREIDVLLLKDNYNKGRKVELHKKAVLDSAKVLIEAKSGRIVEFIEFEDGSLMRYNVVFEGMSAKLFFELKNSH